jgi:hypothetical protein
MSVTIGTYRLSRGVTNITPSSAINARRRKC